MAEQERKDGQLPHSPPTADGDVVRVHSSYECPLCGCGWGRCDARGERDYDRFVILCGKAYCQANDCYTKAVTLLESHFKAEQIRLLASGKSIESAQWSAAATARERMM